MKFDLRESLSETLSEAFKAEGGDGAPTGDATEDTTGDADTPTDDDTNQQPDPADNPDNNTKPEGDKTKTGDAAKSSSTEESGKTGEAEGADKAGEGKETKPAATTGDEDAELELKDDDDGKTLRTKFNTRLEQLKPHRDTVKELGGINTAKRLVPLSSVMVNPDSTPADYLKALPAVLGEESYADLFDAVFWNAVEDPNVGPTLAQDPKAQAVFIKGLTGRDLTGAQVLEAVEAYEGAFDTDAGQPGTLNPDNPIHAELIRLREEKQQREEAAGENGKDGKGQQQGKEPAAEKTAPPAVTEAEDGFFTEAVSIVESVTGSMEWAEASDDSDLEKKYKQRAMPYVQQNIQAEVLKNPEAKQLFEKATKWIQKGNKAMAMDVLDELRPHIRAAAAKLSGEADEIIQAFRENRALKGRQATDFRADHDNSTSSGSAKTTKTKDKPLRLGSAEQRAALAAEFKSAAK